MARSKKEDILIAAKKLFNIKGYESISMRDIASHLGISVGNLTYHFKKKEDLIQVIVEDNLKDFNELKPPRDLINLHLFFVEGIKNQLIHDNYYLHYNQLSKINSDLYLRYLEAFKHRGDILREVFNRFNEGGIFKEEGFPGHYDSIVDILNMIKIHWIPKDHSKYIKVGNSSPLSQVWGVIYPLLTKKGVEVFNIHIKRTL